MSSEFALIEKYIKPLSERGDPTIDVNSGDDCAIINIPEGYRLVITQDAYNKDVHFFAKQPIKTVIEHCFIAALSDLAAMGAIPRYCTLSLSLEQKAEQIIKEITSTLKSLLDEYDISLIGGDTTQGEFSLSFCMLGIIENNKALLRRNAKVGDLIFVSGYPGSSGLGLQWLFASQWYQDIYLPLLEKTPQANFIAEQESYRSQNPYWKISLEEKFFTDTSRWQSNDINLQALIDTYLKSSARISLGRALIDNGLSTTAIDVSDGLVGDMRHIAKQSQVSMHLHTDWFEYNPKALAVFSDETCKNFMLKGGDDYELIFTASSEHKDTILNLSQSLGVPVQVIGEVANFDGNQIYVDGQVSEIKGYDPLA